MDKGNVDTVSIKNKVFTSMLSDVLSKALEKSLGVKISLDKVELLGYEDGYLRARIDADVTGNVLKIREAMKGSKK